MKKIIWAVSLLFLLSSPKYMKAQCNFTLNYTLGANGMVTFYITGQPDPGRFFYNYYFGDSGGFPYGWLGCNPVTHTYPLNGIYSVILDLDDSTGLCSYTDSTTVTVSNVVIDSVSCSVGISVLNHFGNTYQLWASAWDALTSFEYYWTMPDGTHPTDFEPYYIFNQDSTYDMCVTVTGDNGCISSVCQPITVVVSSAPNCNAYFIMEEDIWNPGVYIGYNSSFGNNLSYLWDFGDGTTDTAAYPSHTYSSPGLYLVCLTVDNGTGCTDVYCDSSFYVMKTEGGLMSVLHISQWPLGINTVSSNQSVNIFPNPTTEDVTVSSNSPLHEITVTDVTGREIYHEQTNAQSSIINCQLFTPGLYLLKLTDTNGNVIVKKVVKE